jgi:hypothetical protein
VDKGFLSSTGTVVIEGLGFVSLSADDHICAKISQALKVGYLLGGGLIFLIFLILDGDYDKVVFSFEFGQGGTQPIPITEGGTGGSGIRDGVIGGRPNYRRAWRFCWRDGLAKAAFVLVQDFHHRREYVCRAADTTGGF